MKNANAEKVGRTTSDLRLPASLWSSEGIQGVCHNELTAPLVRHFAGAFAAVLFDQRTDASSIPTVVAASDGRSLTAELFAAAAEGTRWAGCRVIEVGKVPAGAVCLALDEFAADGAIYLGNPPGEPHTVGVRLWGNGGRPWSFGGTLNQVKERFEQGFARPSRMAGPVERQSIDGIYCNSLGRMFHALRPLAFVIDTASAPLLRCLNEFLGTSGCRMIRPESLPAQRLVHDKTKQRKPSFCERRWQMVARQVTSDAADFGVWMDGDGESCRWFDEQGRPIELAQLMTAFARQSERDINMSQITIESTHEIAARRLMTDGGAIIGSEAGSVWFRTGDGLPRSDALVSLGGLLNLLSKSDAPLSRVLRATASE
jgi:phosphomannomutase